MQGTIEIGAVELFVRVAELRSFRGAADALGVPRSTVSHRVSELERALGTRLLQRTTRRVELTSAGKTHLRACSPALGTILEAGRALSTSSDEAAGRLRVTAPVTFGEALLGDVVAECLARHPQMSIELVLTDRQVDLVEETFDLAFRSGTLKDTRVRPHEGGAGRGARDVGTTGGMGRQPFKPIDEAQHVRHQNVSDGERPDERRYVVYALLTLAYEWPMRVSWLYVTSTLAAGACNAPASVTIAPAQPKTVATSAPSPSAPMSPGSNPSSSPAAAPSSPTVASAPIPDMHDSSERAAIIQFIARLRAGASAGAIAYGPIRTEATPKVLATGGVLLTPGEIDWHGNSVRGRWMNDREPKCSTCSGFALETVDLFDGRVARFQVNVDVARTTAGDAIVVCEALRSSLPSDVLGIDAKLASNACACGVQPLPDEMAAYYMPTAHPAKPQCDPTKQGGFAFEVARGAARAAGDVEFDETTVTFRLLVRGRSWETFLKANYGRRF
jgi:molybdenum-dependent DNA-binding transcriptional regulator ModE